MKIRAESPEQQMFDLLSVFSMSDIIGILTKLSEELSHTEREFYLGEIDTWGSIGNKKILINDIIDLVDAAGVIDTVDEMTGDSLEKLHATLVKRSDFPRDPYDYGNDWSEQTKTPRTWQPPTAPDIYTEKDRMRKRPTYKDPDFYKKTWEWGTSPKTDEGQDVSFAFDELAPVEKDMLRKDLESGIFMGVSIPNVPLPYVLDMVDKYLQTNNPEKLKKLVDQEGMESRSRFGFSKRTVLQKMFEEKPPIEELYAYWDSIVNHRHLPLVNPEFVDARYNSGEMINNEKMFENWKETPNTEVRNPIKEPVILGKIKRVHDITDISPDGDVTEVPEIGDIRETPEVGDKPVPPPVPKKKPKKTDYDSILDSFPEIMDELGFEDEIEDEFDEFA